MDNQQEPLDEIQPELPAIEENLVSYPPKFLKDERPSNVWMKSIVSLALYLALGYYIFKSFDMLLVITGIVIFHELGHFFAMKLFRYKDLGIFFIPLLGAYVSGSKREASQKESAVILLAGPLPGIIAGIILYLVAQDNPSISILTIPLEQVSLLLILLNIINLLPIYPLDGGQLLNRVFLDEEGWISRIFVFLSVAFLCWFAISKPFYPLLIFPAMMLMRLFGDKSLNAVENKIIEAGINLDTSYEELPDSDYWKMRDILITTLPAYKDLNPGPVYVYDAREEKIMGIIESLLHRHLIQDVSLLGKMLILIICLAALASPWILGIDGIFRTIGL